VAEVNERALVRCLAAGCQ